MKQTSQAIIASAVLIAALAGTAPAGAQVMDSDRSGNGGQRVGTGSGSVLRDNSGNAGTEGGTVGEAYEGALRSGTDTSSGQSGRTDGDTRGRQHGGFPVGILGLAGLAGLANLFRRRKVTHDSAAEAPARRRATS